MMAVQRSLAAGLTAAAVLWTATLFLVPSALVNGTRGGTRELSTAAAFVYHGAALICHQRPQRSFHLSGVQQPVCARCAGLYISGAAGALAAWFPWRRRAVPYRHARLALAVASLPTAVTLGVELVGLMHPSNTTRALSAQPLGAAAGWVFVRSLRAEADSMSGDIGRASLHGPRKTTLPGEHSG